MLKGKRKHCWDNSSLLQAASHGKIVKLVATSTKNSTKKNHLLTSDHLCMDHCWLCLFLTPTLTMSPAWKALYLQKHWFKEQNWNTKWSNHCFVTASPSSTLTHCPYNMLIFQQACHLAWCYKFPDFPPTTNQFSRIYEDKPYANKPAMKPQKSILS